MAAKMDAVAMLAEVAEFLDGIGIVSPAFDKQVEDLLTKIRTNFDSVNAYVRYCSLARELNEDARDFEDWRAARKRLEELRKELKAERISYGELSELQSLSTFIADGDVELLEAAGVPEEEAKERGRM